MHALGHLGHTYSREAPDSGLAVIGTHPWCTSIITPKVWTRSFQCVVSVPAAPIQANQNYRIKFFRYGSQ